MRALRRAKASRRAIDRYIGAEGGKRFIGEPSTGTSAPKAENIAEGGKYAEGGQIAETKKWPYLDA